ncbi:MAG: patatin-like phospholipase family protein [Mycobacterium leprae]
MTDRRDDVPQAGATTMNRGRTGGEGDVPSAAQDRVGVVLAGAGARGAYEAGVLSVLAPALARSGAAPKIVVGTSAGAINASAYAALAHLDPDEAAGKLLDLWRSVGRANVFRSLFRSGPTTLANYLAEVAGLPKARLTGLLDTAPLWATARQRVDWGQIHANVRSEHVAAVAVVATSAYAGRTVVFVERGAGVDLPGPDDARALDYHDAQINAEHVLASSAIPVAFPAVRVHQPREAAGWYVDGGVRLNAPLKPALSLRVDSVVVVATHPAVYESPVQSGPERHRQPQIADAGVQILDAALADRMVEDVRTLGKINELVAGGGARGSGRAYHQVPYLFVGPVDRGDLGDLARDVYRRRPGWMQALRSPDFALLYRLIGADEPRVGDLLSYLFFDPEFMEAAIDLGREHAQQVLGGSGRGGTAVPWQIAAPRGPAVPPPRRAAERSPAAGARRRASR